MEKAFYLELCTRGFYRLLWGNNNRSDEEFQCVQKQVAGLSKRQRVQMLTWVALEVLKVPGDDVRTIERAVNSAHRKC